MHGHRDEVGESLVIEDREQAEKDHLNDVDRKWNLSRFELGYRDTSPSGYGEVLG